jgi:hypothetical protein
MVLKNRARAARAMVTSVAGYEEGNGDGGKRGRDNDDSLTSL